MKVFPSIGIIVSFADVAPLAAQIVAVVQSMRQEVTRSALWIPLENFRCPYDPVASINR